MSNVYSIENCAEIIKMLSKSLKIRLFYSYACKRMQTRLTKNKIHVHQTEQNPCIPNYTNMLCMIVYPISNMYIALVCVAYIQMIIFMDNSIINKFIRCTLKLIHKNYFHIYCSPDSVYCAFNVCIKRTCIYYEDARCNAVLFRNVYKM